MIRFEQFASLAAGQHGVASRRQLAAIGCDGRTVRRWQDMGVIELPTPQVVRVVGSPATALQRVSLAILDAGDIAIASHLAATWLWRLPGFDLGVVDATLLRGDDTRSPRVARLHRPRLLLPQHVTHIERIPVTSLARTIFDLAATGLPVARLERVLDTVITRSPAMTRILHRTLDELAARGRPGIRLMRELLSDRQPGEAVPASSLERRFEEILRQVGEPSLDRQVNAGGEEWIGRIDFCDRSLALLVEVDSTTFHSGLLATRFDESRDIALRAAGWRDVVRVRENDVWHRPWIAIEQVRAARASLRHAA